MSEILEFVYRYYPYFMGVIVILMLLQLRFLSGKERASKEEERKKEE